MFLFQKKEEKTNYWKIVGITLGIIAAIGATGVALYALLKKAGYFCCDCCDCCECLELECPACGEPVYIDECDVEEIDDLEGPSCGKVLTLVETEIDDEDDCECGCCCDSE